jgi:hypothetical protein
MPTKEKFLEVKEGPHGKGLYTTIRILEGESIYTPIHIKIPFLAFKEIQKHTTPEELYNLLMYGWGDAQGDFIMPLSIDRYVNHSDTPNSQHGKALRSIEAGEEIVEDYRMFVHEGYYSELEKSFGTWTIL